MDKTIKRFLQECGPLLVNKPEEFWAAAHHYLTWLDVEEVIKMFNENNIPITFGEEVQKILHRVIDHIDSPWTYPPGAYASYFTDGPFKCAEHYDDIAKACMMSSELKVYETTNLETGEIDFLILQYKYPLKRFVQETVKQVYLQTGQRLKIDMSSFRELTGDI